MKVDKYDRQIRIWGKKGQKKLSQAKVLVVGCDAPGIQAAKNLILPGVGQVDILDDRKVQVNDLSSSFFYQYSSVGNYRSVQACKNLLQMNPQVKGSPIVGSVKEYLLEEQSIVEQYDLLICSNLQLKKNSSISQKCWQKDIPVIFLSSVGLFFYMRLQKKAHVVQSQNTTAKKYYLRLHDPFPELKHYVDRKRLPELLIQLKKLPQNDLQRIEAQKKFNKICYPVFLVQSYAFLTKALEKSPTSAQIKQLLKEWSRLVGENYREGINEALKRTFDLFQTPDNFLPDIQFFNIPQVQGADSHSEPLYLFLKEVKRFLERESNLPQVVRLPDIHTTTKDFLQLKEVYKEKHRRDLRQIVHELEQNYPGLMLEEQLLSEYINNIDALQIVKTTPYYQELQKPATQESCLAYLQQQKNLYLAIRSYKVFQSRHSRDPKPQDEEEMIKISEQLSQSWDCGHVDQKFIRQISRYQGQNICHIGSIAGAVIGQEAIKLLTNCFCPVNNSYLFNGVNCKGNSLKL